MKKLTLILVAMILVSQVFVMGFGLKEIKPGEYYNLSDYEKLTGKKITDFHEAPMLSELVKQGKLPPVEERLPKNPLVVTPYEEIGQYGGTWRRAWYGLSDKWGPNKICFEYPIFTSKDGSELVPNVFESMEMSEDGRIFTFKIREGLKWSDGVPVTTEDVRFWYEDILLNKELTPSISYNLTSNGKVFKLEIIDDYTFRVVFEDPYPLFPLPLTKSYVAGTSFVVPSHYIKQFHPKYVGEEKAQQLAKENGFENWWQYVQSMCLNSDSWLRNPDLPVLYPWKLSRRTTDTMLVLERNPYYYKIDPEGNQLPYIDEIVHYLVQNSQMLVMKAITGEIDMQGRNLSLSDYQLLASNREKGGYRIIFARQAIGSDVTLHFNQNYQGDPYIRELLRNVKFRQAVSLAINREEIWQLVYHGLGEPRQASLIKGVKYYDPEWEKAFAEYDPERANKLLDEIGLNRRNAEGYRLRPDGQVLEITIEYPTGVFSTWDDALAMIKTYLEKVGIKALLKPEERTLFDVRNTSGEIQIAVWWLDRNTSVLGDPSLLLGYRTWAPLSYTWYSQGKTGGEPPEPGTDMAKVYEIWDQVLRETNEQRRDELVREFLNLHKKNLWMVGTVGALPQPIVVKNNFRNVPSGLPWDDPLRSPKNLRPEQFFFKQ
jgi:peptide/nickel transport system substrate-binding protein